MPKRFSRLSERIFLLSSLIDWYSFRITPSPNCFFTSSSFMARTSVTENLLSVFSSALESWLRKSSTTLLNETSPPKAIFMERDLLPEALNNFLYKSHFSPVWEMYFSISFKALSTSFFALSIPALSILTPREMYKSSCFSLLRSNCP